MQNHGINLNACALSIAGSDSGAGAGIQADLKTFAANGVYGLTVITMITAQSTSAVDAVELLPVPWILRQLETVCADFNIAALKTGALGSIEIIEAVAGFLRTREPVDLVIDPVMISKHGHSLLSPDAVEAIRRELFPLARIITPNLLEAATLTGTDSVSSREEMVKAAATLAGHGCRAVLIKGGHSTGDCTDLLWEDGSEHWFPSERIDTPHTHGTGCTFSAAITAGLVRNLSMVEAVEAAKDYITGAIRNGHVFGRGINPVNHFWRTNPDFGVKH